MFSCPKCSADRSNVLPIDPCVKCGALLSLPAAAAEALEKNSRAVAPSTETELAELADNDKSKKVVVSSLVSEAPGGVREDSVAAGSMSTPAGSDASEEGRPKVWHTTGVIGVRKPPLTADNQSLSSSTVRVDDSQQKSRTLPADTSVAADSKSSAQQPLLPGTSATSPVGRVESGKGASSTLGTDSKGVTSGAKVASSTLGTDSKGGTSGAKKVASSTLGTDSKGVASGAGAKVASSTLSTDSKGVSSGAGAKVASSTLGTDSKGVSSGAGAKVASSTSGNDESAGTSGAIGARAKGASGKSKTARGASTTSTTESVVVGASAKIAEGAIAQEESSTIDSVTADTGSPEPQKKPKVSRLLEKLKRPRSASNTPILPPAPATPFKLPPVEGVPVIGAGVADGKSTSPPVKTPSASSSSALSMEWVGKALQNPETASATSGKAISPSGSKSTEAERIHLDTTDSTSGQTIRIDALANPVEGARADTIPQPKVPESSLKGIAEGASGQNQAGGGAKSSAASQLSNTGVVSGQLSDVSAPKTGEGSGKGIASALPAVSASVVVQPSLLDTAETAKTVVEPVVPKAADEAWNSGPTSRSTSPGGLSPDRPSASVPPSFPVAAKTAVEPLPKAAKAVEESLSKGKDEGWKSGPTLMPPSSEQSPASDSSAAASAPFPEVAKTVIEPLPDLSGEAWQAAPAAPAASSPEAKTSTSPPPIFPLPDAVPGPLASPSDSLPVVGAFAGAPEVSSYPDAALSALAEEDAPSPAVPLTKVWRKAHPSAQRWAKKRERGASRVSTLKPFTVALGLMVSGFGIYLTTVFLPSKVPLSAAGKLALAGQAGVDENAWRFSESLMTVARINAGLFILLGVLILLRGLFRRERSSERKRGIRAEHMFLYSFVVLTFSLGGLVIVSSLQ